VILTRIDWVMWQELGFTHSLAMISSNLVKFTTLLNIMLHFLSIFAINASMLRVPPVGTASFFCPALSILTFARIPANVANLHQKTPH
jgi:hypothetical protein